MTYSKKQLTQFAKRWGNHLVAGFGVLFVVIFSAIAYWKLENFRYNALDLAIFNQVFYNSLHGQWFASSIHPVSYLGDHFSPLIILLLPLYALYPAPFTLVLLQIIALTVSGCLLYIIAQMIIGKPLAVVAALAWFINPIVQNIALFEFSMLPFAIVLWFAMYYFYHKQHFGLFTMCALLALTAREDVALALIMFAVLALMQKRTWRWVLAPTVLGAMYFLFAIKISTLFSADAHYKFFIYYSWLGSDISSAVHTLITTPWLPFMYLLRIGNLELIIGLLAPLGFLSLLAPTYLLLGLLPFLQLALGAAGGSAVVLDTHYASLMLTAVYIAALFGGKKIMAKSPTLKIVSTAQRYPGIAWIFFTIALIYFSVMLGPLPGTAAAMAATHWQLPTTKTIQTLFAEIPPTAGVAATYDLMPALSSRSNIYSFNYAFLHQQQFLTASYALPTSTEYLILDYHDLITYQAQYGQNPYYETQYQKQLGRWHTILDTFGAVHAVDSIVFYQKNAPNRLTLVTSTSSPSALGTASTPIDQTLGFIGFQRFDTVDHLFWRVNGAPKQYRLQLQLQQNGATVWQKLYPWAYDQLTDTVQDNAIIETNYFWLDNLKNMPAGTYTMMLRVVSVDKGGVELTSDRSTQTVIDHTTPIGPLLPLGTVTVH